MPLKHKKIFLMRTVYALLLMLMLVSCTRSIVLDSEVEPTAVVECILDNSKSEQVLYLGYTKGKLATEYQMIAEATAVLSDKTDNRQVGEFVRKDDNKWTLEYTPEIGHTYRLDINIPNYGEMWAECQLSPPVTSFDLKNAPCAVFNPLLSGSSLPQRPLLPEPDKSGNPPDLPNRYELTNGICYKYIPSDCHYSIRIFRIENGEKVYEKCLVSDLAATLNINRTEHILDYYDDTHPQYIGVTTLSRDYRYLLPYPSIMGHYIYQDAITVDGTYDDGQGNYFVVSIDNALETPSGNNYQILIESIAKNVLEYNNRVKQLLDTREFPDYSAIFLRDNLPTNINGGIGIFSCRQEQSLPWRYDFSPDRLYDKEDLTRYEIW